MSTTPLPWEKYAKQQSPWERHAAAPPAPATSPETSQPVSDPTSVGDTLKREVSSLGAGLAGIPGAIYHAAADPASAEEKARLGESGVRNIGPLGRIIERSVIEPIRNAGDWYHKAATGQIPDAYGQALSVAPEALGGAGAAVLGGKIAESAPGAVRNAGPALRSAAKTGVNAGAAVLDNEIAGVISPRARNFGRILGRIADATKGDASGAPVYRDMTRQFPAYAGEDFGEAPQVDSGRPSAERIQGIPPSVLERIRNLPVPPKATNPAIRPSVERILPPSAEPDIETEMRTGHPNPEPPAQPKPLKTQIGTPEEEARIKEMMQGRSAKKLDLERGASPETAQEVQGINERFRPFLEAAQREQAAPVAVAEPPANQTLEPILRESLRTSKAPPNGYRPPKESIDEFNARLARIADARKNQ